ncbi:hypothetical protein BDK51DRAFT_24978 [Blyttiomyces helicus]|uniref:Uncharacterized protein n=1 Tax=Blyttiomyces helicus TaxID=388810 RepID=A0A4P9WHF7_9FUNG|nr:hypothetical protein BDK51DRAFT_24978 [Blyttiomyces helicus]|eukprot:RKO90848.1 hypothetical protein BDK51DRAFT_24978 [Blyttiomyces helicus]
MRQRLQSPIQLLRSVYPSQDASPHSVPAPPLPYTPNGRPHPTPLHSGAQHKASTPQQPESTSHYHRHHLSTSLMEAASPTYPTRRRPQARCREPESSPCQLSTPPRVCSTSPPRSRYPHSASTADAPRCGL